MFESRCHIHCFDVSIILFFGFGGRDVSDRLEQTAVIEPVDPFERGIFNRLEGSPGSASMDDLGLVEAVDCLGQSVVVAVADAADRWLDPGLGKPFAVSDRDVLATAIGVMDETAAARRSAIMECLFERIEQTSAIDNVDGSPPLPQDCLRMGWEKSHDRKCHDDWFGPREVCLSD